MSARKRLPPPETIPAMVRFRQIAAEAKDHLLLADGPPHPDHDLLDLCADALHLLTQANRIWAARPEWSPSTDWTDALRAQDDRIYEEGATQEG